MAEIGYQVLWPLGKLAYQMVSLQPRIADLKGKTICELVRLSVSKEKKYSRSSGNRYENLSWHQIC